MGIKQHGVASPLVATKEKKRVGIIRTIVDLFIGEDSYLTVRIKPLLYQGTEQILHWVWLEKRARGQPWEWPLCSDNQWNAQHHP